jgi:hypothetical protein
VATPETVASLIESWVRTDLTAPAFAPIPRIERSTARAEPDPGVALVRPTPEGAEPSLSLDAALLGAVASDGNFWAGASVGALFRAGGFYVGPSARILTERTGENSAEPEPKRIDAELLANAELPVQAGELIVRPGFGLGLAWHHTRWETGEGPNDPADQTPPGMESHASDDTLGPRADLHVTVSAPLRAGFLIDFSAAVDLAPLANIGDAPAGKPPEPWTWIALGLGLRWEAL